MSNNKMEEKEIWTEKVLQSLEGINRAEPRDDLFNEISSKVEEKSPVKVISLNEFKWIAAVVFLIFINTYSIINQFSIKTKISNNETAEISIITNYSLYNK